MRNAVITGVSSDIGQAVAKKLEEQGWKVTGLSHEDLDLTDLKAVADTGNKLNSKFKEVSALIHIAGVWHDKDAVLAGKKLEQFKSMQIIETMDVGVTSFMLLAAKLLPKMTSSGAVIGISGTFSEGGAGWLPYYTSKRALEDFLVGLSQDYVDGPKIYGISPADTSTKAFKKFYPEYVAEAQPPGVIADLAIELVGGNTSYKSGDIIEIRGGKDTLGFHK